MDKKDIKSLITYEDLDLLQETVIEAIRISCIKHMPAETTVEMINAVANDITMGGINSFIIFNFKNNDSDMYWEKK